MKEQPGAWCGHFAHDINGNCMTCAREARRCDDMAQAFDEGVRAMSRALQGGSEPVNPYRTLPPGEDY